MVAQPGDWVIKGIDGEFYPCKSEIFDATYEPVSEYTTKGERVMNGKARTVIEFSLVIALTVLLLSLAACFTGCSNSNARYKQPKPRPGMHALDHIWMDEDKAIQRSEHNATHPPKNLYDRLTR